MIAIYARKELKAAQLKIQRLKNWSRNYEKSWRKTAMRRNAFPSGTGGLGGPRRSFQTPKFVVFF